MIKRIVIDNFQSIEHLEVIIDAGITVFRGESRQGKSAILRAMRVVTSMPRGTKDIRTGAASCGVMVETDKGVVTYSKLRAGSVSYTTYNIATGATVTKNKVTEVPHEVFEILNIGNVEVDEDLSVNINYASQLEPHFLLAPDWGTPTAVAKVIGKITNVDKLSLAARACAGDLRTAKMDLGVLQSRVSELGLEIGTYSTLDQEEDTALKLVDIEQNVTRLTHALSKESAKRYSELDALRRRVVYKLGILEEFPFKDFTVYSAAKERAGMLRSTLERAFTLSNTLLEGTKRVKALSKLPFTEFPVLAEGFERLSKKKAALTLALGLSKDIERGVIKLKALSKVPFAKFSECSVGATKLSTVSTALSTALSLRSQMDTGAQQQYKVGVELGKTKEALTEYLKKTKVCPTCDRPWEAV